MSNDNQSSLSALSSSSANPAVPAHVASREPDERAAASRVEPDIVNVRDDDTEAVNLDVATIVGVVSWVVASLRPFLSQLAAMPRMDMVALQKLQDYAHALSFWHQSARLAVAPPTGLTEMVQQGVVIREHTVHDLGALARHGVIDGKPLETFTGSLAHRKVGADLVALSILTHAH